MAIDLTIREFYKRNEGDIIYWVWYTEQPLGVHAFTFDKVKIYHLFRDYPWNMTPDEVAIFDKENPFWADFFAERKTVRKTDEEETE